MSTDHPASPVSRDAEPSLVVEPRDRMAGLVARLAPRLSMRWRNVLALALTIIAVQALFWGVFYTALTPASSTAKLDRLDFSLVELAKIKAPTAMAASQGAYSPVTLPHTECCEPVYLALRLTFALDAVPEAGLGLATFHQVDNFMILANGSLLLERGRMEMGRQTFHGQTPYAGRIPAGLLRAGDNTLTFITLRDGFPYSDLYPPIVAPWEQVSEWSRFKVWQVTDYRLMAGWTTFILGLFAGLLALRSQDRRLALWLMLLCWSWSGYAAYGLWLDLPLGGIGRLIFFFAINSLVPTALVGFIDAWTGRPIRGLQAAVLGVWGLFSLACAAALAWAPPPQGYDGAEAAWVVYSTVFGLLFVGRLVWHFASDAAPRRLEAAILSIVAVCVVLDALGDHFGLSPGGYLLEAAPVLILALMAAFLQRNLTLFRSAEGLNTLLAQRLNQREAELAAAHVRERDVVRRQAHDEERRRIMRDMHDGPGSQLMSLLLAARRGAAGQEQVTDGLQSVIDEMRLMIDSMDSVGESLGSALSVFHERIRPRVEMAGFALDWVSRTQGPLPDYSPRAVLQVFRILQEAVINALKHSGGDRLSVRIEATSAAAITVVVADNGRGLGQAIRTAGRGRANMQARARSIGADLDVHDREGGVRVILTLRPQHEGVDDD